MIRRFLDSLKGEKKRPKRSGNRCNKRDIPGLPEYWNAENTSQRIVDFAVLIYCMFQGEESDFLDMIRSAINEGFKRACDIIGNLPGEVGKSVSDT